LEGATRRSGPLSSSLSIWLFNLFKRDPFIFKKYENNASSFNQDSGYNNSGHKIKAMDL
jgi:hypothetical protein